VSVGVGLKQIPQVTIEILEDGNRPVALSHRLPDKDNTLGLIGMKVAPEVIGVEKQEYPASGLISDSRRLFFAGSSRKKQACFGRARRPP
jgi:hypothetical protein